MRNPPPPAHYNPPPMFGLRIPPYVFTPDPWIIYAAADGSYTRPSEPGTYTVYIAHTAAPPLTSGTDAEP